MSLSAYRTFLLDRDGVIIRNRPDYVRRIEDVELLPGAAGAIQRLCRGGHRVIVVTNQSAVGRGLLSISTLTAINRHVQGLVSGEHGGIERFFVCPHHPADGCACRKPRPGLLFAARDEAGVDLANAVVVGDMPSDLEAARAAGCRAILVGHRAVDASIVREFPDVLVDADLAAAVDRYAEAPITC